MNLGNLMQLKNSWATFTRRESDIELVRNLAGSAR